MHCIVRRVASGEVGLGSHFGALATSRSPYEA